MTRDGNFTTLKTYNLGVFKVLFTSAALILLAAAYLTAFQRMGWRRLGSVAARLLADFRCFWKVPRLQKCDNRYLLALALITVMAVIFRLDRIYAPFGHDEAYTFIAFSSNSLFDTITAYHLPNNHVFHSVLVNIVTHLLGIQPWVVRLPAFIAGVLMVPAAYLLAKTLYDKETALASALLAAYSPALVSYSTNARGYTILALITLLLLALGVFVRRESNLFAWLLIILFSAIGFFTIPVMLFPFGVVFTWLFMINLVEKPGVYSSRMSFFKYWLIAGIAVIVLALLLYTPIFIYSGIKDFFANGVIAPLSWPVFPATLQSRLVETWLEWQKGFPPALVILLGLGFTLGLILHRRISCQKLPVQLAALTWILILLLMRRPNASARFWLFLLPLTCIWSVAGVIGLLKVIASRFTPRCPLAHVIVGVSLLGVTVLALRLLPGMPEQWASKGEPESIVLFLKDDLRDADLILVTSSDGPAVWYYSRLYGVADSHFDGTQPFERVFIIVSLAEQQTVASIFRDLSLSPPVDLDQPRLIQKFGRLSLYEYEAAPAP